MVLLKPGAKDVARLLIDMGRRPWPATDADRRRYFDQLGLHDAESIPLHDESPDTRSWRVTTSLSGDLWGIATAHGRQFSGVNFFCYSEPGDDGPQARAGFANLGRHLSRALGKPAERWGPEREPACLWHVGSLQLDMYCFQRDASGLMVGLARPDPIESDGEPPTPRP